MKKILITIFSASMLIMASCGEARKDRRPVTQEELEAEFIGELCGEDTVAVMNLSTKCMDILKTGKIYEAVGMLYSFDAETGDVSPLTEEQRSRLETQFALFPVVDYDLESFRFSTSDNNEMIYRITFEEPLEGEAPATIRFQWSPVKKDGKWYLTVK